MSTSKPFPSITGSCACNTIRYRLLTSPLFCYTCHCRDCQKSSGSAFGLFLNIEYYNIKVISPTQPVLVIQERKPGVQTRNVRCPKCSTELWGNNGVGFAICDLHVGTLDFPSLMEPDLHSFVESKVDWVVLPPGAKTTPKGFEHKDFWPRSSLKRLEICLQRVAQTQELSKQAKLNNNGNHTSGNDEPHGTEESGGEGDKTPTAVEFEDVDAEDDEAFEKRFEETESALRIRLERLRLKLEEEEVTRKTGDLSVSTAQSSTSPG